MCQIAELDFGAIDRRMSELVDWISSELDAPRGCCGELDELTTNAAHLTGEDKLFYILLATHFASPQTAREFYERLDWTGLLESDTSNVWAVAADFFRDPRLIGDHRRHFRCMPTAEKVAYTLEVLDTYKRVMQACGSQGCFFDTDAHPDFEALHERLREITPPFHRRLPRFDYLEALARTHDFYIVPNRFFADEDEGGPRDGLTYLLLGLKLRKTKGLKAYLLNEFPNEWNVAVEARYRVPARANLQDVIRQLEIWTIDRVRGSLPAAQRNSPAHVFALESCLCNWQKGK